MQKVEFGKTAFSVSRLGFGAAPIGYLKIDQDRIATILNLLLDSGVNLIDTAASYPGSEEAIGNSVSHRRDQFVLVSKCGSALPDVAGKAWSAELISETVDRSLRLLKTDHLDVMLLHSCDLPTLQKGEAVGALVKAQGAGKVRFAGYSGDNEAAAYATGLPQIAVLETSVSIADQMNLRIVLPKARQNNLGVIAKRPIANAAWKDPGDQPGLYGNYASEYSRRLKQMGLDPSKFGFSGPPEQAWPEFALRFTLSMEGVHTAIIGTTNPENASANIEYAEKGPLPPEAVRAVLEAFNKANPQGTWRGEQ